MPKSFAKHCLDRARFPPKKEKTPIHTMPKSTSKAGCPLHDYKGPRDKAPHRQCVKNAACWKWREKSKCNQAHFTQDIPCAATCSRRSVCCAAPDAPEKGKDGILPKKNEVNNPIMRSFVSERPVAPPFSSAQAGPGSVHCLCGESTGGGATAVLGSAHALSTFGSDLHREICTGEV